MYERIMVPLDGSNAAETVLPYLEELAPKFKSEILLVSVAEPKMAETDHLFRAYLQSIQSRIENELGDWGAKVEIQINVEVLSGKPANEILRCAEEKKVSLLVMASRGRSGDGPWLLGNIAAKVLRATTQPVLLIRSGAPEKKPVHKSLFSRILVPLDGSKVAEQIIPHAAGLAKRAAGELILLQAFQKIEREVSGEGFGAMTEEAVIQENKRREEEVKAYLKTVGNPLRGKGLTVSEAVVSGDPAEKILEYAEPNAVDIITMPTHGRSGIKRWVFGSVTDKVLHAGDMPILVVRAREQ